ncbi:MAG: hypothetical protein U0974_07670 [Gemmatimonadales bacterium]|nr:hypothetical protein [Gemmatimonadales bacterium]MDZ4389591.1 hypothetical protein [Gemmatimonadales bacterium]
MISLRTIVRGVLTRFLPAFLLGTAIMYGIASRADRLVVGLLGLATVFALVTLGYAAALIAMRFRLRADANVAGRRSVVAGLLAPAAYLGGLMLLAPRGTLTFFGACVVIGAALATGMFFPWLKGPGIQTLTDQEAQHLLEESRSDLAGLGESRQSAYAEIRNDQ